MLKVVRQSLKMFLKLRIVKRLMKPAQNLVSEFTTPQVFTSEWSRAAHFAAHCASVFVILRPFRLRQRWVPLPYAPVRNFITRAIWPQPRPIYPGLWPTPVNNSFCYPKVGGFTALAGNRIRTSRLAGGNIITELLTHRPSSHSTTMN